jgi:hypothetical protein
MSLAVDRGVELRTGRNDGERISIKNVKNFLLFAQINLFKINETIWKMEHTFINFFPSINYLITPIA